MCLPGAGEYSVALGKLRRPRAIAKEVVSQDEQLLGRNRKSILLDLLFFKAIRERTGSHFLSPGTWPPGVKALSQYANTYKSPSQKLTEKCCNTKCHWPGPSSQPLLHIAQNEKSEDRVACLVVFGFSYHLSVMYFACTNSFMWPSSPPYELSPCLNEDTKTPWDKSAHNHRAWSGQIRIQVISITTETMCFPHTL